MLILIDKMRIKVRMSTKALVDGTGISRATIYRYENHLSYPSMDAMEIIAKVMGVGINDLFESDYKQAKETDNEYELLKENYLKKRSS